MRLTASCEVEVKAAWELHIEQVTRISTQPRGTFALDDASLVGLGRGEAVKQTNLEVVQARLLNGRPAPRFEPAAASPA